MNGYLLDVNVLIALTWPTHVHHTPARRWFDRNSTSGWATCPITQLGFLRFSSHAKINRDAVPPHDAVAMLQRLIALSGHAFWPDEDCVTASGPFSSLAFVGHRQVTDAYLLALAQHRGGKLTTLDGGIRELIAERDARPRWVELIQEPDSAPPECHA